MMKTKLLIYSTFLALPLSVFASTDDSYYNFHNGKYIQALEGLKDLANKQNKEALYYQAELFINGYGVAKDLPKGIQLMESSGERGYLPAQMFLGKFYLQKNKDAEKAFYWFKKAANQGDVDAQMFTAAAYLYGVGVKANANMAKSYYIMASKNGNPVAQYTLAVNFLDSRYRINKKMGLIWLTKSAEQNNPKAEYELGRMYLMGDYVNKDKDTAMQWLTKAADQGYVKSYYLLGKYYQNLKTPDLQAAIEWYEKAAKLNYSPAKYQLGMLYLDEKSPVHDNSKAFTLILSAAQANNVNAQEQLVKMYEQGIATETNPNLAQQWQKKLDATKQNKTKQDKAKVAMQKAMLWISNDKVDSTNIANYKVSGILSDWQNHDVVKNGSYNQSPKMVTIKNADVFSWNLTITNPNSVNISEYIRIFGRLSYENKQPKLVIPRYQVDPRDYKPETFKEVERLANLGNVKAQFILGSMYEQGLGVKQNLEQALYWFNQSSKQNYMRADYSIGLMFLEGKLVKRNYKTALRWLKKAAFKGDTHAQYVLGMLYEFGVGQPSDPQYIKKDIDYAIAMYNFAANGGLAQAQLNLADIYASGLFTKDATVTQQRSLEQFTRELYQAAAKKGLKQAELALAFYYSNPKSTQQQQQWAFNVAKKEAEKDNGFASLLLAIMYDRGIGIEQNTTSAIKWYKKAVAQNNPVAQFILGTYYYTGKGVRSSTTKADDLLSQSAKLDFPIADYNLAVIKYKQNPNGNFLNFLQKAAQQGYTKANLQLADYYLVNSTYKDQLQDSAKIYTKYAELGYPLAQLKLGYMYEHGIYYNTNYNDAAKWYEKAAKQNNVIAQYLLANMYQVGKLNQVDLAKAMQWYKRAAKNGFVPAMVAIGFIYETDQHHYQAALDWYQKAAKANSPQGQFNLALMYEYGKGIKVDKQQAYELFEKAVKQNFAPAEYALGKMYVNGQVVNADVSKAEKLFQQAAAKGNIYAMYQLALINEAGVGVSINVNQALKYYTKAANKGNIKALLALARLYNFGLNVRQNKQEAFNLYERAAAQGNASAQFYLAQMYQNGDGVEKNTSKAKSLYNQAMQNGNQFAKYRLDQLAKLAQEAKAKQATDNAGDANIKAQSEVIQTAQNQEQKPNQAPQLEAKETATDINAPSATVDNRTELEKQIAAIKPATMTDKNGPNILYMDALNDLNSGNLEHSISILKLLIEKYPKFSPAQKTYQLLSKG